MTKKKDYKQQLEEYRKRGKKIIAMRDGGDSWVDIGNEYRITRQAAQQAYKRFKGKHVTK